MRKFYNLWAGDVVSDVGTASFWFIVPVLAVEIMEVPDSQLGLLLGAAGFIPSILSMSIGAIADRTTSYWAMHACNFLRAATMGVLAWAAYTENLSLVLMGALMLITDLASNYYDSMIVSITPRIVARQNLTKANSLVESASAVTSDIGSTLAGVAYSRFGGYFIIAGNALSYLYASVSLAIFVRPEDCRAVRTERIKAPNRGIAHLADLKFNLDLLRQYPLLVHFMLAIGLYNMSWGFIGTLLTPFALENLGLSVWQLGLLSVPSIAVGIMAPLVTHRVLARLGAYRSLIITYAMGAIGYAFVALAMSFGKFSVFSVAFGLILVGICAIMGLVVDRTARQALIPHERLAGVSGLVRTFTWGIEPVGAVVAGYLSSELIGRVPALCVAALLCAVSLWIIIRSRVHDYRTVDALLCQTSPSSPANETV
ncbi:MAG: MFS transporter [Corynebacterium sp.]|nr:MFS transporter [Corynebacterium sp.]